MGGQGGEFSTQFWAIQKYRKSRTFFAFSHADSKCILRLCLMQSPHSAIILTSNLHFIQNYFLTLNYSSQDTVGWLGFWSQIVACGTALISGHVADKLIGHFKMVLLILLSISTFSFIWMCFICTQVIPFSIGKYLPMFPSSFHHV